MAEIVKSANIQIFTICARNYAAFAASLAESLAQHHPEATFTTWLLDEGELPSAWSGLATRSVKEALTPEEHSELSLRYDVLELSTAVKPAVFKRLFAEGAGTVVYLDPDIYFFRPMQEVFALLEEGASGVLVPHMMSPQPDDGQHPDDLDILRSGIYNLGFLALAKHPSSIALLDWWWRWLKTHCYADPKTGVFTDQKWMNFAPMFWPEMQILRHPGYDVAYWNLYEREIGRGDTWTAAAQPLVFYHFSGFDPSKPGVLSKHQDRFKVATNSSLAQLLAFYAERLNANGASVVSQLPLPEITFDDGIKVDRVCRTALRMASDDGLQFTSWLGSEAGGFRRHLAKVEPGQRFCNYIRALFELRPDGRRVYEARSLDDLAQWMRTDGRRDLKADPALFESLLQREAQMRVNYVGYLRAELGIAEAARGYIAAFRAVGGTPHLVDISKLCEHDLRDSTDLGALHETLEDASVNIFHVNADELPNVLGALAYIPKATGAYNIANWAWETPDFPDQWMDRFDHIDEVWVGSRFIAEAISRKSPRPVVVMPYVVEVPEVKENRQRFGLDDEFVFLVTFDFLSLAKRKNPHAAIRAFAKAFRPDEPVRLLIKTMNGSRDPGALAQLRALAGESRVTMMDTVLDSTSRYQLLKSCDAYVSLHRAEGFGLGLAEAMAYGKPVIATGWSGNMDFMDAGNSLPVSFNLFQLEEAVGPYGKGTTWAEPDVDDAAAKMRQVFENSELRARIARVGPRDVRSKLGTEAVGEAMYERLMQIQKFRTVRTGAQPVVGAKKMVLRMMLKRPLWVLSRIPKALAVLAREGVGGVKRRAAQAVLARR